MLSFSSGRTASRAVFLPGLVNYPDHLSLSITRNVSTAALQMVCWWRVSHVTERGSTYIQVLNFGRFFQPSKTGGGQLICRLPYTQEYTAPSLLILLVNASVPETNLHKSFSQFLYNLLVLLTESLDVAERLWEFRQARLKSDSSCFTLLRDHLHL